MNFAPIVLDGFDGREEALGNIDRYIHEITPVMFYRSNDLVHSRRVLWHLEAALPDIKEVYGDSFDEGFARTLAYVHDDGEIITGDVQLHDKEHMSERGLELLKEEEKLAIPQMVEKYGKVANGYDYGELLVAAKEKNRLEAWFVSFFDKFDGGGEAWHEIWAGNSYFCLPAGGNDGQKEGYVRRLREFPEKYPDMKKFFNKFPEYLPEPFDFKSIAEKNLPHTKVSLLKNSGYSPYERWKKTIIKNEGFDRLINQIEF